MTPKRQTGIITQSLGTELLLYNPSTQCCSNLDQRAAFIWECIDGVASEAAIAARVSVEFPQSLEQAVAMVGSVLTRLGREGFLAGDTTRRQALGGMLKAAAVLPLITSVTLPRPAAAASLCTAACSEATFLTAPCLDADTCCAGGGCGTSTGVVPPQPSGTVGNCCAVCPPGTNVGAFFAGPDTCICFTCNA
ncbi:MAG: PqqD family protein [Candidatus Eremiobacteraeota bacterium]|nr:PqqD family protein [Candidatus Eremiobacteraeota bacterium]